MRRGHEGIRPWKSQRDRPEAEVTHWEIDSAGAFDAFGVPLRRVRRQVEGSKAKAIANRRALLVELEASAPGHAPSPRQKNGSLTVTPSRSTVTLRQYVEGAYQAHSQETHRATTNYNRMKNLRTYIVPVLGALTVDEVNKPMSVTKLREALDRRKRKLANSTKTQILLALSSVLTMAEDPDLQPDGVALIERKIRVKFYRDDVVKAGATTFSADGYRAGHARHKRLDDSTWQKLVEGCRSDEERVVVGLGLFAGCRISEVGARLWKDVDFDAGKLYIWSSICPHSHKVVQTKNALSGWVPLPARLLEPLSGMRKTAKHEYILGPDGLGRPTLNRAAVAARYKRLAARLKVDKDNYHALRHTYCCRLADAGMPAHVIQRLARHSSIETTYGYIMPSEDEMMKAATIMDF